MNNKKFLLIEEQGAGTRKACPVVMEVMKETDGNGADIVIDAVGCLISDAVKCVKASGSVLLFGQNYLEYF